MEIRIHEDTAGLGSKMRLPAPAVSVRWAEIPRSNPRGIGPTDTRLFVLAEVTDQDRPKWIEAFGEPIRRSGFHLPPDVAERLLPPELLAQCPLDSSGRAVPGTLYRPSALAAATYEGAVAAGLGNHLILEFLSR
ncbi:MAG: hypothetical protein JWP91_3046 [Fibrobacteres bacterium]|nr:hypothetical protein [Fibrobacterota bacterium]